MSDSEGVTPTRRQLLGGTAGLIAAALGIDPSVAQEAIDATGGSLMALTEATNVAGDLYVGPDSAKGTVTPETGRVYKAVDTGAEYYADGSSWTKQPVDAPSVQTDEQTTTYHPRVLETRSDLPLAGGDFRSAANNSQRAPEPVITWIFDDAYDDNYTNGHPVFKNKDAEYGVSILTQKVGTSGRLTWSQIKEMARTDALMEPVSHGYNGVGFDGSTTNSEIQKEIYQGMSDFLDRGYRPTQHTYVGGATGGDYGKGVTSEVYPFAWGIGGTRLDEGAADPYQLPRITSDNTDQATIESEIDSAVSNNNGICLYGHHIIDGTRGDENNLETADQKISNIIDYARNNGMTWVSPTDLLKRSFVPFQWGGPNAPTLNQRTDGRLVTYLRGGAHEIKTQSPYAGGSATVVFTSAGMDMDGGNINMKGSTIFGNYSDSRLDVGGWTNYDPQPLQNITGSRGDVAYHDGSDTNPEGFYEWDNGNSQWSGIGVASGNTI